MPDLACDMLISLTYVPPEGHAQEHFLKFIPIESNAEEALTESVFQVLEEINFNIENSRGYCYDNAANMSGMYKGLRSDFI